MPAVRGTFNQSEEAKEQIAEATRRQWKNPQVRARRSAALKAAWARKKANLGICETCGQPLPEEEGR